MLAEAASIDVVAHNIANINTAGYKRFRTAFEDIANMKSWFVSPETWPENPTPEELATALGAVLATPELVFSEGKFIPTNNLLDLAISGEGLFQVQQSDGTVAYTRDGCFKLDGSGQLVNQNGLVVLPGITVPQDATNVTVNSNGQIYAKMPNSDTEQVLGTLELARFNDPSSLFSIGNNLYVSTDGSGEPTTGQPDSEGFGIILSGILETSNVDLANEMLNMILSQRAYQINLKTLQTIDQMREEATNLLV